MAEPWVIESRFRLERREYREGWWMYYRHSVGGLLLMGILAMVVLTSALVACWSAGELLIRTGPADSDYLGAVVAAPLWMLVFGWALARHLLRADAATRAGQDITLRCNEADVEVECAGNRRRWAWPEFWVYLESPHVCVLIRGGLHVVIPRRAIPTNLQQWFYLMGQQSTSPRRNMRRQFEVILGDNRSDPPHGDG